MLKRKIIFLCALTIFSTLFFSSTSQNTLQAKEKKDLILGITLEPPHLDPSAGAASVIDEILYGNVFEGLTRLNEKGEVLPALAKNWEIQENGKIYFFTLEEGVQFHDGKPFRSDDVKFSLDRARGEKSVNAQKILFKNIDRVETPTPYTVKITLKRPQKDFPWIMALGDAIIVSKDSVDRNKYHPCGTGPFRFQSWKRGSSITLIGNAQWRRKPVFLERVDFRIIPDPFAALAALFSGDVDVFPFFPAPESREKIERDGRFSLSLGWTQGETILAFNHKRPPFHLLKIRQAIAQAINKNDLIEGAMFNLAYPIGSHCTPQENLCQTLNKILPYDPQKAQNLLSEHPIKQDKPFSLLLPPTFYARRSGEIIAMQLKKIGIRVNIIPVGWADWLQRVFKDHDFDLTIVAHTEPRDIDIYARKEYYFGYHNASFNFMLEQAEKEQTFQKNLFFLQKAQKIITEDVAAVFLFSLPKITVSNKKLKGLWINAPIPSNDLSQLYWED